MYQLIEIMNYEDTSTFNQTTMINKATPTKGMSIEEWMAAFKMSPPRKVKPVPSDTTPCLTIEQVKEKLKEDNLEKYIKEDNQSDNKKIVYYLYGREFLFDKNKKERTETIGKFLLGEPKKRMLLIVHSDHDSTPLNDRYKVLYQKAVLRYSDQTRAITIFEKRIPFVGRIQASCNCYLNAVSTFMGYKVAFSNKETDTNLIACSVDISKLVRYNFNDEELVARVVDNKGGSSICWLNFLCHGNKKNRNFSLPADSIQTFPEHVGKYLGKFGPAPVTKFSKKILVHIQIHLYQRM